MAFSKGGATGLLGMALPSRKGIAPGFKQVSHVHSRSEICWDTETTGVRVCRDGQDARVDIRRDDYLDSWLVLRVGGPHPQLALFERSGASILQGKFRLCRAGTYSLHIRAIMLRPWVSWHENWTAHPRFAPCMGDWGAGVLLRLHEFRYDGHGEDVALCSSGLWSWSKEVTNASGADASGADASGRALLERITPSRHPNASTLERLYRALRFTEPALRRPTPEVWVKPHATAGDSNEYPPPQASLSICVIGDSQMRTLADGMVQHIAESGRAGCGCKMAAPDAHKPCPKQMAASLACTHVLCAGMRRNITLTYFQANYGTKLWQPWPSKADRPLVQHLGNACSTVLFNSGQWWASWKPKPKPPHWALTPAQYAVHAAAQMASLGQLATQSRVHVAWVASNPFPINAGGPDYTWKRARPYDMSVCPPVERRFPHVLHAYNEEAKHLAAEHQIGFVDNWQIALPLFDLSEDGAHYAWRVSPVGRALAAHATRWVLHAAHHTSSVAACLVPGLRAINRTHKHSGG